MAFVCASRWHGIQTQIHKKHVCVVPHVLFSSMLSHFYIRHTTFWNVIHKIWLFWIRFWTLGTRVLKHRFFKLGERRNSTETQIVNQVVLDLQLCKVALLLISERTNIWCVDTCGGLSQDFAGSGQNRVTAKSQVQAGSSHSA